MLINHILSQRLLYIYVYVSHCAAKSKDWPLCLQLYMHSRFLSFTAFHILQGSDPPFAPHHLQLVQTTYSRQFAILDHAILVGLVGCESTTLQREEVQHMPWWCPRDATYVQAQISNLQVLIHKKGLVCS